MLGLLPNRREPLRRPPRSARVAWWATMLLLVWNVALAAAAPPRRWEVMRIYIPADPDQTSQLVPSDYTPIEIEELASELSAEAKRRKESLLAAPSLDEAIYVARLDGDMLVSDQSVWKLNSNNSRQPLQVGQVSVALRDAYDVPVGGEQLSEHQRFAPNGDIELILPDGDVERWFGFSVGSQRRASRQVFDLHLPAAPLARMLIAAPPAANISSGDVVVERIQDAAEFLPEGWLANSTSSDSARQWWLVHLSGRANFELMVESRSSDNATWYQHRLRSAQVDYVVSAEQLQVRGKFILETDQINSPLRLKFAQQLRIGEVLVNGKLARWRAQSSLSGDSSLVELLDFMPDGETTTLEVEASCPLDTDERQVVPEMGVAGSYALSGVTTVYATDGLVTDSLEAEGCVIETNRPQTVLQPGERSEDLLWTASWLGSAPKIFASFSKKNRPWIARSLTRFAVQPAWVSAICRFRMESNKLDSNELRLRVGKNWFVDSVKLAETADADIRVEFIERGDVANPSTDIVLNWEKKRESIVLEIDVFAHSPRDTSAERISLSSPRLVRLPNADQLDNYVIEPTGRFRVQANTSLLRFQLQPGELPAWQQELLPRLSDKWIFRGTRGVIPPIDLVATGGTFSSKITTIVREGPSGAGANYFVQCQPISGSIDHVEIVVPSGIPVDSIQWELMQHDGEAALPLSPEVLGSPTPDRETVIDLVLPGPMTTKFVLSARMQLDDGTPQPNRTVPIVSVPQAVTGESLLVLPKQLAPRGRPALELLPATLCCSTDELSMLAGEMGERVASGMLAARLDAGLNQKIMLQSEGNSRQSRGWIRSEHIEHWIFDGGQGHNVQWAIEGAARSALDITLPAGWWIEAATIDGEPVLDLQRMQNQLVRIGLPDRQRCWVTLRCAYQAKPSGWISHVQMPKPLVSLAVLDSKELLWVPPGLVPLEALASMRDSSRLVDRLSPTAWWRWLAPTPMEKIWTNPQYRGWKPVELDARILGSGVGSEEIQGRAADTDRSEGLWLVEHTAMCAMALALVLALAAFFWTIVGKSVRVWWLLLSSLVVAVVVAQSEYVPLLQLLLLSAALGALTRMLSVVTKFRMFGRATRSGSGISGGTKALPASIFLATILSYAASSSAQQPSSAVAGGATSRSTASEDAYDIFGVLIPVDEEGQVSGAYAYVPSRLWNLLTNPDALATGLGPPKILSADYTLRPRQSTILDREQTQELTAEFLVRSSQLESELVLPFSEAEVRLLSGRVNGQEIYVGARRLVQEEDGVTFRPSEVGTLRLELTFEIRDLVESAGRTQVSVGIPPIPAAKLRVASESSVGSVEVESIGRLKKSISGITADLGPLERLQISWSSSTGRSTTFPSPAGVFADTWVHGSGSQLVAACQLRIGNNRSLDQELHFIADASWEPVGTRWGDGELISSELLGSRRVYKVRVPEYRDSEADSELVVRVFLVPSNSEGVSNLAIPFFSLREVAQQGIVRTFAWSTNGTTAWKPDGVDFWQQLRPTAELSWEELAFDQPPTLYRIPVGSVATNLRRVPVPEPIAVDETTRIHLSIGEVRVRYQCRWQEPVSGLPTIQLAIPSRLRVESVLVDGQIVPYHVASHSDQDVLVVSPDSAQFGFQVVEVEATQPLQIGRAKPLPRIVAQDVSVGSSIFRLFHGAGLACRLESETESGIELEQAHARPTDELLANLEVLVGQIDLQDEYREDCLLPLNYTLTQRAPVRNAAAVMYLDRSELRWKARLEAIWESGDQHLDFVFFELPTSIRESVDEGQLPIQFIPMGDSARTTLCIMPPPPVDGRTRVSLQFNLPTAASSQAISIPQVVMLTSTPIRPILALPSEIDGRPIRWSKTGRRKDGDWTNPLGGELEDQYQYFEMEQTQLQATWKPIEAGSRQAELEYARATLISCTGEMVSGYVDYWIHPHGQLRLNVDLPQRCQVIGMEIGASPAIWQPAGKNRASVLLQPNYLPVRLRVLMQWESTQAKAGFKLTFPTVDAGSSRRVAMVVESRVANWDMKEQGASTRELETATLADSWAALLQGALPIASGLAAQETEAWLADWHPLAIGLDGGEPISAPLRDLDTSDRGDGQTVSALWTSICEELDVAEEPSTALVGPDGSAALGRDTGLATDMFAGRRVQLLSVTGNHVFLEPHGTRSRLGSRLIAGGLLVALALLLALLATQTSPGYFTLLCYHPWVYWLQLAAIVWFLLPVSWPSWILALTSVAMLVSQSVDHRRRSRSTARG